MKTKDLVLNNSGCLLSRRIVDPKFLQVNPNDIVRELGDDDDDKSTPPPLRAQKRGHVEELDQAIRKVCRKRDLPQQISKDLDLLEDGMDALESEMNAVSDNIYSLYCKYNELVDPDRNLKIRTTHEIMIDADGTETKTWLPFHQSPRRMKSAAPDDDDRIQIIMEMIRLDREPESEDDDEIEQVDVEEEEEEKDERKLVKVKSFQGPTPEVGWTIIACIGIGGDGTTKSWMKTKVDEVLPKESIQSFDLVVKFGNKCETVPSVKVAYFAPWNHIISKKVRVIFCESDSSETTHYYPGIIADNKLMKSYESHYLVYLDNGACRYIAHKNLRVVCGKEGWGEFLEQRVNVFPETNGFVDYLVTKPWNLRRMPRRFKSGGVAVVLKNGKWLVAEIQFQNLVGDESKLDVVQVYFEHGTVEWIYRGSPRFHQVLLDFNGKYPDCFDDEEKLKLEMLLDIDCEHNGLSACVGFEGLFHSVDKNTPKEHLESVSPLLKPLLDYGWTRTLSFKSKVVYTSPCRKEKISTLKKLFAYLHATKSDLPIDWFCFDKTINIHKKFLPDNVRKEVKDISCGLENIPIPCVNSVDDDPMPEFKYSPECVKGPDVVVMDEGDKAQELCCDCTDNCTNYSACACRRKTFEPFVDLAAKAEVKIPVDQWFSYIRNRKLMLNLDDELGIFECGKRCSCSKNLCTNRVVQNGMMWPLLVFKTKNKGWAVRAICDIPKGSFICIYSGALNTVEKGSEIEAEIGNEYSLNLNYLKTLENFYRKHKPDSEDILQSQNFPDDQRSFIINPKRVGNVGRFFSHSCEPNMFLQNVFVGSHDPRFPKQALFTSKVIKAGTELTWDYGKHLSDDDHDEGVSCYCGAVNCKKRLLL